MTSAQVNEILHSTFGATPIPVELQRLAAHGCEYTELEAAITQYDAKPKRKSRTRPAILASTLHIERVGTSSQLLGRDAVTSEWHILATLDASSDARVMLSDMKLLARALKFNLVEDRPPPRSPSWIDAILDLFAK